MTACDSLPLNRKHLDLSLQLQVGVLGMGYLFPSFALFSAFDYWKEVFQSENVEYQVYCVYQTVNIISVLYVTLVGQMDIHDRTVKGFAGQFIAVLCIMAATCFSLPSTLLYWVLMFLTGAAAIATACLDSALLSFMALCDPRLQVPMQVGIGVSSLSSVVYRIVTKALGTTLHRATLVYFAMTLVTIGFCWHCYYQVRERTGLASRDSLTDSLMSKSPGKRPDSLCVDWSDWRRVVRLSLVPELFVLFHFAAYGFCYPGLITSVPVLGDNVKGASSDGAPIHWMYRDHWYQELLLLLFCVSDTVARFALTSVRFGFNVSNFSESIVPRVASSVLLFLVSTGTLGSGLVSLLVVALSGFLGGLCVSLSVVHVNEADALRSDVKLRTAAGRITALCLSAGLWLGGVVSAFLYTATNPVSDMIRGS